MTGPAMQRLVFQRASRDDDSSLVRAMWSLKSPAHHGAPPAAVALYDRVEFMFQRGTGWRASHEGQPAWKARPRGFVYAQGSGVIRLKGRGVDRVIGFRVSPIVVSSMLSHPPVDFWNKPVALPDIAESDCHAQCLFSRALQSAPLDHLDMMSSQLGWARHGLQRLCAKSATLSARDSQLFRRHVDACALLRARPDLDLTEVARHVGFDDYAEFTHSFSECIGLTPMHFRRSDVLSVHGNVL